METSLRRLRDTESDGADEAPTARAILEITKDFRSIDQPVLDSVMLQRCIAVAAMALVPVDHPDGEESHPGSGASLVAARAPHAAPCDAIIDGGGPEPAAVSISSRARGRAARAAGAAHADAEDAVPRNTVASVANAPRARHAVPPAATTSSAAAAPCDAIMADPGGAETMMSAPAAEPAAVSISSRARGRAARAAGAAHADPEGAPAPVDHRALIAQSMAIPEGWTFLKQYVKFTGDPEIGGEGTVSRATLPGWLLQCNKDSVDDFAIKVLPHASVSVTLDGTPETDQILPRLLIMPWGVGESGTQMVAVVMPHVTPFLKFLSLSADAIREALSSTTHEGLVKLKRMKFGLYALTMYVFDSVQNALRQLHEQSKCHGDVKPANVVMKLKQDVAEGNLLCQFGEAWVSYRPAGRSLRDMSDHLRTTIEAAPTVSLIDVSDGVVTHKYSSPATLQGGAADSHAWGVSLFESLFFVDRICCDRDFNLRRPLAPEDALRALSLPECQQLTPLFTEDLAVATSCVGRTTSESLVTDGNLLKLRTNSPSITVAPGDIKLFKTCCDEEFIITEERRAPGPYPDCVFRFPELDRTFELLRADPLTEELIETVLDDPEHDIAWRAAIVVLHEAYMRERKNVNSGSMSCHYFKLARHRKELLDCTRRAPKARVPWETIMRWQRIGGGSSGDAAALTCARTHRHRTVTLPRPLTHNACWKIVFAIAAARACARAFGHTEAEERDLGKLFSDHLTEWIELSAPEQREGSVLPPVKEFSQLFTQCYEFYLSQKSAYRPGRTICVQELTSKPAVVGAAKELKGNTKGLVFGERDAGAAWGHCTSVVEGYDFEYVYFDTATPQHKNGAAEAKLVRKKRASWCDNDKFEMSTDGFPLAVGYSIEAAEPSSPTGTPVSSPVGKLRARLSSTFASAPSRVAANPDLAERSVL